MFFQFKKLNNESGIVLFIVLMTSIIIMIYSLSVLTQSMNEINYAQQQIDQLTTEQWSKGAFWNAYSNEMGQGNMLMSTTINNRTYWMQMNFDTTTNNVEVVTNYDTFQ